jgi:hypothetical protein
MTWAFSALAPCRANESDRLERKQGRAEVSESGGMMSAVLHFPEERLASFTCSVGAADIGRYTVVDTKGACCKRHRSVDRAETEIYPAD